MPPSGPLQPTSGVGVALVAALGLGIRLSFTLTGWHEGNVIADDAFYYYTIARNILEGQGSTFDGLAPTNGYHPLWMALLVGLFTVSGTGLWWPLRVATTACAVMDVVSGWILYRMLVGCGWHTQARIAAAIWLLSPFTVTDVLGVSGRAMLEALIAGERDATKLAKLAQGALRNKRRALVAALAGRFTQHHALLLGQILAHSAAPTRKCRVRSNSMMRCAREGRGEVKGIQRPEGARPCATAAAQTISSGTLRP